MLFTEVQEKQSDIVYPGGTAHDDFLNPIRRKLSEASLFAMDEQALAMAANVSITKPSSILASLPFVNLPADVTWLEYANVQARQAAAELGSPNIRPDNASVHVHRSGFLMYLDIDEEVGRKDIVIEYVHKDRPFSGTFPGGRDTMTDIAPVIGRFSLADIDDYRPPMFPTIPRDPNLPTTGKIRKHQALLENDPGEAAAWHELRARFSWEPHPDLTGLADIYEKMIGPDRVAHAEAGQAGDLERSFLNQVLPALILLNCRNAVIRDTVPAPDKLNKKRAQKGRAPIREFVTIKVHLSGSARRAMARENVTFSGAREGAFVIGHFKVRRNGIYWWGFHMRGGGPSAGASPRRIKVMTF
ncbi:hypothetical protein G6L37_04665 [Agrobacterium rubi]|nr:hypothetical protein [Agrobacterium rubi]NTF24646.1 hypothetical protein [Agrobacterium rubi]